MTRDQTVLFVCVCVCVRALLPNPDFVVMSDDDVCLCVRVCGGKNRLLAMTTKIV